MFDRQVTESPMAGVGFLVIIEDRWRGTGNLDYTLTRIYTEKRKRVRRESCSPREGSHSGGDLDSLLTVSFLYVCTKLNGIPCPKVTDISIFQ